MPQVTPRYPWNQIRRRLDCQRWSAQSKLAGRFCSYRNPTRIIVCYILTLFAAVAGVVAFPFSLVSMGVLFVVVGAFAIVAIPIIVVAYLFLAIAFYRGLMALGCRLLFGEDPMSDSECATSKPPLLRKHLSPQRTDTELWDRWIDGF